MILYEIAFFILIFNLRNYKTLLNWKLNLSWFESKEKTVALEIFAVYLALHFGWLKTYLGKQTQTYKNFRKTNTNL